MIPFDIFTPIISKVLDFIPDPKQKAEAQLAAQKAAMDHDTEILKLFQANDAAQDSINEKEAQSPNWFIAGSRPFILWVCGISFCWTYLFQPILVFILAITNHPINNLPKLDMSEMMPVLLGLLGLGGMRSWEKYVGVNNQH